MLFAKCFAGVLFFAAAIMAGYAVLESEPDFLEWAAYVVVAAVIPWILVVLNNLCVACGRGLSGVGSSVAQIGREMAENSKAERAERQRQREAKHQEESPRVTARERLNRDLHPDDVQEQQIKPLQKQAAHQEQSLAVGTSSDGFTAHVPTHRVARTIVAVLALFSFLALPQFQIFVNFNGVQIVRFMSGSESRSEPTDSGMGGEQFLVQDTSGSDAGIVETTDAATPIMIWIAIIGLILGAPVAYFGSAKADMFATVICALFMIGVFLSFFFSTGSSDNSDNPLAETFSSAIGFSWGFFLTLLLVCVHAAMAVHESRKADLYQQYEVAAA